MQSFLEKILVWSVALVAKFGYAGIFLTMALESALVPVPSEVVLPFSGFLASSGQPNLWLVVAISTLANLTGSVLIYVIGWWGGRPFLNRYGKYILIHSGELNKVEGWLSRHGSKVAFWSRLLPGVRGFSSIIFGAGRLDFKKFFWYTLFGSFIWNFFLTYVGYVTGGHWNFLEPYFKKFELLIGVAVLIGVILFFIKHWGKRRDN